MNAGQNLTKISQATEVEAIPRPYSELTNVQQHYVDYKAVNGLIVDPETGVLKRLSVTGLAELLGVSRTAIYDSVKFMPNFWDLVAERRTQLNSQTRLAMMHETWTLKARSGSWPHLDAWLRNFDPNYKEAKQKVETDIGEGLIGLLNAARKKKIIEGEVVGKDNTGTSA